MTVGGTLVTESGGDSCPPSFGVVPALRNHCQCSRRFKSTRKGQLNLNSRLPRVATLELGSFEECPFFCLILWSTSWTNLAPNNANRAPCFISSPPNRGALERLQFPKPPGSKPKGGRSFHSDRRLGCPKGHRK